MTKFSCGMCSYICFQLFKCSMLTCYVYLQIKQLTEELSAAVGENERLLSERSDHHEQSDVMEKMKADVTALTEERDQLQERLQQLEKDDVQMKAHLEEKNDMVRKNSHHFELHQHM